jgi:dihydrofolate reductase
MDRQRGNMSRREVNGKRSTVTLHVVASLDGFIAKRDNSVSWLENYGDTYERGVSEDSVRAEETVKAIDCFVLGSRTYEHALQLGWPYADTPTIVVTSRELPSTRTSVEFYSGDLQRLVEAILAPRYENIWLVGGATLGQSFLRLGLVDEIRLMVAPILLGEGLPLFGNSGVEKRWRLKDVIAYKNGFVELSYGNQSTNS